MALWPIKNGPDEGPWEELEAYRPILRRCCSSRLYKDPVDVDDAVQETFVKAIRSRKTYNPSRASLERWLKAIANNVCNDLLRERYRQGPGPLVPLDERYTPTGSDIGAVEKALALKQVLEHMDVRYATAWWLRNELIRELTLAEIAKEMGVSVTTVQIYLHKAREYLMSELGEDWDG
jgi:RNA polymerase sigma-70 factor, ECF subfamily